MTDAHIDHNIYGPPSMNRFRAGSLCGCPTMTYAHIYHGVYGPPTINSVQAGDVPSLPASLLSIQHVRLSIHS